MLQLPTLQTGQYIIFTSDRELTAGKHCIDYSGITAQVMGPLQVHLRDRSMSAHLFCILIHHLLYPNL